MRRSLLPLVSILAFAAAGCASRPLEERTEYAGTRCAEGQRPVLTVHNSLQVSVDIVERLRNTGPGTVVASAGPGSTDVSVRNGREYTYTVRSLPAGAQVMPGGAQKGVSTSFQCVR